MVIGVTIGTKIVLYLCGVAFFVTAFTGYQSVLVDQWIVSTRMVKIFHALYLVKGNF